MSEDKEEFNFELSSLILLFTYVPVVLWPLYCWKSLLFPGEEGQKWPPRLLVASEVSSDLKFELSGLNNLCFSASLASFVLYSTKCSEERKEGRRQNRLVDSHCFACS